MLVSSVCNNQHWNQPQNICTWSGDLFQPAQVSVFLYIPFPTCSTHFAWPFLSCATALPLAKQKPSALQFPPSATCILHSSLIDTEYISQWQLKTYGIFCLFFFTILYLQLRSESAIVFCLITLDWINSEGDKRMQFAPPISPEGHWAGKSIQPQGSNSILELYWERTYLKSGWSCIRSRPTETAQERKWVTSVGWRQLILGFPKEWKCRVSCTATSSGPWNLRG